MLVSRDLEDSELTRPPCIAFPDSALGPPAGASKTNPLSIGLGEAIDPIAYRTELGLHRNNRR